MKKSSQMLLVERAKMAGASAARNTSARTRERRGRPEAGFGTEGVISGASRAQARKLDVPKAEPGHLQEQPAVAEAGDVGLAVGAVFVAHRQVADAEIKQGRAKKQVEV